MENTTTRDAENIKDETSTDFVSTPTKAPRGRPPGKSRKESLASDHPVSGIAVNGSASAEESLAAAPVAPTRINGRLGRLGPGRASSSRVNNDKPIFTLSVAAEILHLHARTLRIYEEHNLVVPMRTQTNRRRYSQNDIKKFQFIQYLTRERGVNLSGVKIILALLDELHKTVSDPINQVFPDYGESDGFPLL